MLVDVECVDGVWTGWADWMPEGEVCTGASFEEVFWDVVKRRKGGHHGDQVA